MQPIIVPSPIRGEWVAVTTPGDKIPSHGTDNWGMTYAYDFIRIKTNENGSFSWHNKHPLHYLLAQVKLANTYGWGEPIYSPISGTVREVENNVKERNRLHVVSDIGVALFNSLFFSYKHGVVKKLGGNYIIIEGNDCCAFLAHAKTGSIQHKVGDVVSTGDPLFELGHSGNSTAPHLHFQLMDRVDIKTAKGLPCAFTNFKILKNQTWQPVDNDIPTSKYPCLVDV